MLTTVGRVWGDRRVRLPVTALVVGLTVVEVYRSVPDWGAAISAATGAQVLWVAVAGLSILAGGYAAMRSWAAVLHPLTQPSFGWATVFFVGQLGKYMPGSVWAAVIQARLGSQLGGKPRQLLGGFVVTFGVSVVCAVLLGSPATWTLWGPLPTAVLATGCMAVLAALTLVPALGRAGARVLEVPDVRHNVARSALWSSVGWFVSGVHLAALAIAVGAPVGPALVWAVPAAILAVGGGSLVIFAPGGIGVRELIMLAALAHLLPPAGGAAVVVLSRLIYVCGDVVLAGACFMSSRVSEGLAA